MDPRQEIEQLRERIEEHSRRYYVENAPVISDYEFDQLFTRLKQLEGEHPEFASADSPTQKVGGETLEGFEQVTHSVPMLSLDNSYSIDDLREFDQRVRKGLSGEDTVEYVAELKIDGVSVSLQYRGGVLERAATRGNGAVGDNITVNVRTIRSVPLRLAGKFDPDETIEIRGEVYMPRPEFEKLNEERESAGEQPFANPRNATAGSLKLLDSKTTAKRPLNIFLYWLRRDTALMPETHSQCLDMMQSFGLPVEKHRKVFPNLEDLVTHIETWGNERSELNYETDGMVIKVNRFSQQRSLGETSHHPRYAIAFKYPPEQKPTRVLSIEVQVGRTGKLTPVANLEPVQLSGTIVKRATLHNEDEIRRLEIREGDTVMVRKAGEIIPQIVAVLKDRRTGSEKEFVFPDKCPVCETPVVRGSEEVNTRCPNPFCEAQLRERLQHFCSRASMDIENMGPSLINQLVDKGLVHDFGDLYSLRQEDIESLDRMAEKSTSNVVAAIDQSRKATLDRLLFGLGIPMVGSRTAKLLADEFGSLDAIAEATEEQLTRITDIGPRVAASILEFFQQESSHTVIKKLRNAGLTLEAEKRPDGPRPLEGKTFVITGTLSRPRDDFKRIIESAGGTVSSSVSKNTGYVLVGEDPGSKRDKAAKLGVPIIGEDELSAMLETEPQLNRTATVNTPDEPEKPAENDSAKSVQASRNRQLFDD